MEASAGFIFFLFFLAGRHEYAGKDGNLKSVGTSPCLPRPGGFRLSFLACQAPPKPGPAVLHSASARLQEITLNTLRESQKILKLETGITISFMSLSQ